MVKFSLSLFLETAGGVIGSHKAPVIKTVVGDNFSKNVYATTLTTTVQVNP